MEDLATSELNLSITSFYIYQKKDLSGKRHEIGDLERYRYVCEDYDEIKYS